MVAKVACIDCSRDEVADLGVRLLAASAACLPAIKNDSMGMLSDGRCCLMGMYLSNTAFCSNFYLSWLGYRWNYIQCDLWPKMRMWNLTACSFSVQCPYSFMGSSCLAASFYTDMLFQAASSNHHCKAHAQPEAGMLQGQWPPQRGDGESTNLWLLRCGWLRCSSLWLLRWSWPWGHHMAPSPVKPGAVLSFKLHQHHRSVVRRTVFPVQGRQWRLQ